jgi:FixJ family two-component response regulator
MTSVAPRILLIDPDLAAQTVVREVCLANAWSLEIAEPTDSLLRQLTGPRPSCVLVAVQPRVETCVQSLRELHSRLLGVPLILTSAVVDVPLIVRTVQAGAADFLLKPLVAETLQASIARVVAQGERPLLAAWNERQSQLTPRQLEIMQHLLNGQSTKAIAAVLQINRKTVEKHRAIVLEKMQADNVVELMRSAVELKKNL